MAVRMRACGNGLAVLPGSASSPAAMMGGTSRVSLPEVIAAGQKDFRDMGLAEAYCGAPAEATVEEGEASYETLADMTVEVIRGLVAGTGGRDRSGLFGRV